MRMLDQIPRRSLHVLAVTAVVASFSALLLGCPDKANPDPATGKDAGATTATTAPAAGGSAAAPAKSGGW